MPILDLFWSMLWFFLFILWIWLVISIFVDIFRSDDLSGWGKAGWTIGVIIVPFLGVFLYLIVRGGKMQQRAIDNAAAQQQAANDYIRDVATSSGGVADELEKLGKLRDQGALTDAEYDQQKAKLLS